MRRIKPMGVLLVLWLILMGISARFYPWWETAIQVGIFAGAFWLGRRSRR